MKMYTPEGMEVLVQAEQVATLKEAGWTRKKPAPKEESVELDDDSQDEGGEEGDAAGDADEGAADPAPAPAPKKKTAAPKKKVAIKKG